MRRCVDIEARAALEAAGGLFVDHFRHAVGVHRIDIHVFFHRQGRRADLAIGETHAVGGFRRGDDDLADAKLDRRLDDVVGAHGVDPESLVVRTDQNARHRCEVHHGVQLRHAGSRLQFTEIGVAGHGIEHLPGVGDVGREVVHAGMVERRQVDIEHVVAVSDQVGNDVPPGLAGPAGEQNAHIGLLVSFGGSTRVVPRERKFAQRPVRGQPRIVCPATLKSFRTSGRKARPWPGRSGGDIMPVFEGRIGSIQRSSFQSMYSR